MPAHHLIQIHFYTFLYSRLSSYGEVKRKKVLLSHLERFIVDCTIGNDKQSYCSVLSALDRPGQFRQCVRRETLKTYIF